MKTYLNTMSDETTIIRRIAYELKALGNSFYNTGNDVMSTKMHDMAAQLDSSQETIMSAVGTEINQQYQESQERSATILEAALAGAKLEREES